MRLASEDADILMDSLAPHMRMGQRMARDCLKPLGRAVAEKYTCTTALYCTENRLLYLVCFSLMSMVAASARSSVTTCSVTAAGASLDSTITAELLDSMLVLAISGSSSALPTIGNVTLDHISQAVQEESELRRATKCTILKSNAFKCAQRDS